MNANFSGGLLSGTPSAVTETGSLIGPLQIAYNDGNNPWAVVVTDQTASVNPANGLVRKFLIDGFGRTNQIVDVTNSVTYATSTLVYDRVGLVTNIIDASNNKIEYAYNDLGQTVAMADPDLGYWQYARDYAGRLKDQIDAKGQRIRFNYNDALGRLKSRNIYTAAGSLAHTVTYTYDTGLSGFTVYKGQLGSIADREGVESYSYDVRGRTLKSRRQLLVNNVTYTNEFTFDSADRVSSVKYTHGGPTVTNLYDAGGNLAAVKHVSGAPVYFQAKGYNELGQLLGINFGNGTETTNAYFAKTRRLQSIISKKSGAATNFQNLVYTYNEVADLTAITDGIFTSGTNSATLSSIVYDNHHRLKSLNRPGPVTTSFAYDRIGNITSNGEEGGSAYGYNTSGLLAHAVKTVGTNQ